MKDETKAKIRSEIDRIDRALLQLLAVRREWSREMGVLKKKLGLPIRDLLREESIMEEITLLGREHGLDEEFLHRIFRVIIDDSVQLQIDIFRE